MKLAITFYITNYSLMKEHWDENSILKDKNIFGTNVPMGIKKELGGKIVIFDWDMFGKNRIIEIGIDHREIDYPTLAQTTHLNSVIYVDEDENKSYVVSFHQGQVIEIDKKTLKVRTILSGLDHPHSVYKLSENFLVSDTNKNRILIFDNNGKILKSITGEFDWIQDAIKLSNGNYLIADSNNFRLVEV